MYLRGKVACTLCYVEKLEVRNVVIKVKKLVDNKRLKLFTELISIF